MAEKGAHISATYLKKPSIFELIAQESLGNTFHPALKRIAVYMSAKNPSRYGWLVQWYEECFFLFNAILQYHYLKNYGATFSEYFYSLQRVVMKNSQASVRLPAKHEFISLLCATLFPYLKNTLHITAEKYKSQDFDDMPDTEKRRKEFIIRLHKCSHFILEICSLYLYLRYMTGHGEQYSLFLWLADVTLVYQQDETEDISCWKTCWSNIRSGNLRSVLWNNPLKNIFSWSLEVTAFFIQFLNWWHAEQSLKFNAYPVPSIPQVVGKSNIGNGICPICTKQIEIETALSVSGYVFCFKCIKSKLAEMKKCPVTNLPADENSLIRLYPDS